MSTTKELLAKQKAALRARMVELRADIDALIAPTADLKVQRAAAIAEQNALDATIEDFTAQIDAIEQPRLYELKMELSQVAQAESAIKLSDA
jgi:DNA repair exonuclease SbcCD ATPase subunit